jgi:hypothetical protein
VAVYDGLVVVLISLLFSTSSAAFHAPNSYVLSVLAIRGQVSLHACHLVYIASILPLPSPLLVVLPTFLSIGPVCDLHLVV